MSERKEAFVLEGHLLQLWNDAQEEFLKSPIGKDRKLKERAEDMSDPGKWLETFQKERHNNSSKFSTACSKFGRHLQIIQTFVQVAGFTVNVTSLALPAVSPASLIINAFAWLFDSFAKISEDFDKIEGVFELVVSHLRSLSSIGDRLKRQGQADNLQGCIVKLFICCLKICQIASEQAQHRFRKFSKQAYGSDELNGALTNFATADDALRLCLDIETFENASETRWTAQRIEATVNQLNELGSRNERDEMLDWLSSLDSPKTHDRIKQQYQGGTWLLESGMFKDWKEKDINQIWYTGNPGAGKSVLASIIIEHLKLWARSKRNGAMVAYLYLSYESQPDMGKLLGSLLRQFQTEGDPHPEVLQKFREYRQRGKFNSSPQKPSLDDIKLMLSEVSANKTVFVVVDALDEFNIESRGLLLQHIKDIESSVKILVTSRVLEHLKRLQVGFKTGEIKAHVDDMDKYIEHEINFSPSLMSFPTLHEEIKTQVKRKSEQMFIIVRLHMEALQQVHSKADLEAVLEKLPSSIDGAYENTLERIRSRRPKYRDIALSTLGWVAYAERLLWMPELRHALDIEQNSDIREDRLIQESEIISACCGLLVQDVDDTVRPVHRSALEFLSRVKQVQFPDFNRKITLACVQYLSMPSLQQSSMMGKRRSIHAESSKQGNYPLAGYAGKYLHKHHRRVQDEKDQRQHRRVQDEEGQKFLEAVQMFVSDDSSRELYSRLLIAFDAYDKSKSVLNDAKRRIISTKRVGKILQPLHIAVYLGSPDTLTSLIDEEADVNALDPYGQSALTIAIKGGLYMIAGILLKGGAKVDLTTKKGHISLLYIAERDYDDLIKQIIGNPTSNPLDQGLLKILGILLLIMLTIPKALKSFIVEFFPQTRMSRPLTRDSLPSGARTAEVLALDSSLEDYKMLLHSAYTGDLDNLQMLLELPTDKLINLKSICIEDEGDNTEFSSNDIDSDDGDIDSDDSDPDDEKVHDYFLPFSYKTPDTPSESGDKDSTDDHFWNSASRSFDRISLQSEEGRSDDLVTGERSDEGIDDNTSCRKSDAASTPSLEASNMYDTSDSGIQAMFREHTHKGLLDEGEPDQGGQGPTSELDTIKMAFVRTACFLAAERSQYKAVKLFLEYGASPNLKNFQGQSLLHRATARNDYKLVELLIKHGVDVNQRDRNGRTALMASADLKRNRVVLQLLIRNGASLHETQREGCHELYEAAVFGATEVVKFYLEQNVDPSITNNFGWTPLHGAAANGHLECVELLVEKNVNLSPVSDTGRTPLDFVQSGSKHYDHILTGGEHYKAQIVQAKQLTQAEKDHRKDDIENLLSLKKALTSEDLKREIGIDEFHRRMDAHRSWQNDSWWDNEKRNTPWYRHED
ncbi:hypothetical protein Hte_005279 [Hypoxylon texense]